MNIGRFFIDRPRFAAVISILIVIAGTLSFLRLPVALYPEIAPPTIAVRASYPGASPEVIADTVSTVIEQEINGVENMLYMSSQATSDGQMQLTITFKLGTDLDTAQVQVQNRIAVAEPRLPEEVRRLGVTANKSSPDLMMVINLRSPNATYDPLYISNFAQLRVRDVLLRINGVGSITIFGVRDYSMRIWLDPERLATLDISADDVVRALQAQNVQVASGTLGQPPMPLPNAFQFMVKTQGRFIEPDQFRNVIIKAGEEGRLTRLGDVARVELAALDYSTMNFLNGVPGVGIAVFQRPGSNALETARQVKEAMEELSKGFPPDLVHQTVYDLTAFVDESVSAVYTTMFEAIVLVILVIVVFLQSWRAAVIPIVAIPVSLIGTFAVMELFGFSLNTLSLFGLVLAIGIVVDDAIVVVENIERNLDEGLSPKEAARVTMDEVATALISIALVLIAVFVPAAFLGGITGQFFQQFALTVAVATIISAFNSLTLSPALGAILLRRREEGRDGLLGGFFGRFNRGFDYARELYGRLIRRTVRQPGVNLAVFVALLGLTAVMLLRVPSGFIPHQDQGVLIGAAELPQGAENLLRHQRGRQVLPVLEGLEQDEHRARVRGAGESCAGKPGHADDVRDARHLEHLARGVQHDGFGPFQRRSLRQLRRPDQHALVLVRNEARRYTQEHDGGQAQQRDEY
ncbi:MAG TPA: efflux RND transporter permease subunit, partial [Gammaproteobacteria bacterium]